MRKKKREEEGKACGGRRVHKMRNGGGKVALDANMDGNIGFGLELETDFGLMSLKGLARALWEENLGLEQKRLKFI